MSVFLGEDHDDSRQTMRESFKSGMVDFLDKNSENTVLLAEVYRQCKIYDELYRKLHEDDLNDDERRAYIEETGMFGTSKQLFELCKETRVFGPTQATVLIQGESGTGKELVAEALHKWSDRAKNPFVAINIGSEQANLLDSTLFGHKKGSFTGATEDRPGKFRQAHGGTIFLDEIGDLGLDLQVKLLRVLQERVISPVGSNYSVPVDVRVIAATHKNLEEMVKAGAFREDLYYRLQAVIITTTPLRDRPDDIVPLLLRFTQDVCKRNNFTKAFQSNCLEVLKNYGWPGNVRELQNVVERHLIATPSDVSVNDLQKNLHVQCTRSEPETMEEIEQFAENFKRTRVKEILEDSRSKAQAARRLNIPPNLLHYFIAKWKLR